LWQAARAKHERDVAETLARELDRRLESERRTTKRLENALLDLQLLYLDQAVVAALAVDQVGAEEALNKACEAGLSSAGDDGAWRLMVQGLIAQHTGRLPEAIALFEQARNRDPDIVAIRAALAFAYEWVGFGDNYGQTLADLGEMQVHNKYDRLFKASVSEIYDTSAAVNELESLVEEHPYWILARVMLASAKTENAWCTADPAHAEEALRQIRIAKEILPELPMLLSKELMANLCIAQLTTDAQTREAALSAAREVAERLEATNPQYAPRELAAYYFTFRDDPERAISILEGALTSGAGPLCDSFLSAMLYHEGRFEEMTRLQYGIWGVLEVEEPEAVVEHYKSLDFDEQSVSVPLIWSTSVLYKASDIAGDDAQKQRARDIWRDLLIRNKYEQWNIVDALRWLSQDSKPEVLLKEAKQSGNNMRIAFSHFCMGYTSLVFRGNRQKAREHLDKCVACGILRFDIHYFAQAILQHLDAQDYNLAQHGAQ
jgi:tetratricopeptide (TPR) repeat protein